MRRRSVSTKYEIAPSAALGFSYYFFMMEIKKNLQPTGTETFSDHRLVIIKIQADWTKLYRMINTKKQEQTKKVNTRRLITEEDTRKKYSTALDERIKYTHSFL